MRDIHIINQILKKYDLMLPVLPREQRKIYRSKRRTLADILGAGETSSFKVKAAVRFFYIMRNMGMSATVASGARAAVFASVIAVMVAAGGSVLLLQNYIYRQGVIAVDEIHKSGVITASGDLKINRDGAELTSLKAADIIKPGDEIITGESSALFQFDNGAVVKILKKSSVLAVSMGKDFRFDLKSGGIVSRIPQLPSGSGYEIYTPDSSVSVKGTEFGVIYENGKTRVFVSRGTVGVRHLSSGTEYDVTEGNSTEVNTDKKSLPVPENESIIIKGFAGLDYVESIGTKSPGELQALGEKLKNSDKVEVQSKTMTLAQMKEKYGKIDEITLYSGRKYTGVIISRGGVYKILTTGGVVTVNAKEVKGSRIVQ